MDALLIKHYCMRKILWAKNETIFANEGGAFVGGRGRLNNSGVQIVLENSQLHAARRDLAPID